MEELKAIASSGTRPEAGTDAAGFITFLCDTNQSELVFQIYVENLMQDFENYAKSFMAFVGSTESPLTTLPRYFEMLKKFRTSFADLVKFKQLAGMTDRVATAMAMIPSGVINQVTKSMIPYKSFTEKLANFEKLFMKVMQLQSFYFKYYFNSKGVPTICLECRIGIPELQGGQEVFNDFIDVYFDFGANNMINVYMKDEKQIGITNVKAYLKDIKHKHYSKTDRKNPIDPTWQRLYGYNSLFICHLPSTQVHTDEFYKECYKFIIDFVGSIARDNKAYVKLSFNNWTTDVINQETVAKRLNSFGYVSKCIVSKLSKLEKPSHVFTSSSTVRQFGEEMDELLISGPSTIVYDAFSYPRVISKPSISNLSHYVSWIHNVIKEKIKLKGNIDVNVHNLNIIVHVMDTLLQSLFCNYKIQTASVKQVYFKLSISWFYKLLLDRYVSIIPMNSEDEVKLFNTYADFLNNQAGFNSVIENCIGPYMQNELLMFFYKNRMTLIENLSKNTKYLEYLENLEKQYPDDPPTPSFLFSKHTFDIFVKNYFGLDDTESIVAIFERFLEIFENKDDDISRIDDFLGPNASLSSHVPPIYSHLDMSLTVPETCKNIIGYTTFFIHFVQIYRDNLFNKMEINQMFKQSTPDTIVRDMYILKECLSDLTLIFRNCAVSIYNELGELVDTEEIIGSRESNPEKLVIRGDSLHYDIVHPDHIPPATAGGSMKEKKEYFTLKGRRYRVHKHGRRKVLKTSEGLITITQAKEVQKAYLKTRKNHS